LDIGDLVVRKSYGKDVTFRIVDMKDIGGRKIYTIKGINLRVVADAPEEDLEEASVDVMASRDQKLNKKVNASIKTILATRNKDTTIRNYRSAKPFPEKNQSKTESTSDMTFGRPGKVLHIDGDADYLDNCLKVYKQLSIEAVGRVIPEKEQPVQVLELIKQHRPDIVVITGHDAIAKDVKDYMDLNNYRNSRYFVESVTKIREYQPDYDGLVVFAGACQSCYEAILDAGANFASSPGRVLIHCLDPVFLCEKIAYASISSIVSIQDALTNTVTGTQGIGGLQTRGKYREGFPKSPYV